MIIINISRNSEMHKRNHSLPKSLLERNINGMESVVYFISVLLLRPKYFHYNVIMLFIYSVFPPLNNSQDNELIIYLLPTSHPIK